MKMRVSTTSICICAVLVLSLPLFAQFSQQGPKLTATATLGNATQGFSVSVSGGGSTAIVGAPFDADRTGAAWIWNRSGQNWTLGAKLVSPEASGAAYQGYSAAISGDGLTAIVGGPGDTTTTGAAWIWVRDGGNWTQQAKLVGSGSLGRAQQGVSVALSGDGNTAIVGGPADDNFNGATWVFTRSDGVWSEQAKLIGDGAIGAAQQGGAVSLSGDGNTALIGGYLDNSKTGAAWVFTRNGAAWTQSRKLVGTGATGNADQGYSVALSADGTTAAIGGPTDNALAGATWVWTRDGTNWTQAAKLRGVGAIGNAQQGSSVAISLDGSRIIVGALADNKYAGAAWVFVRSSAGVWTEGPSKLIGSGTAGNAEQGAATALSADGSTAIVGGYFDNGELGAAWVFNAPPQTCTQDTGTLCLGDNRFAVSAEWQTSDGKSGQGQGVQLTSDTGYFTFFSASNVEVVVKVLNACGLNSKYWVFAGGLTNVNVVLTVRDTVTGSTKIYTNPQGTPYQPIQDTDAFATCSAHGSSLTTSLQAPLPAIAVQPTPEPRPVATCTQNATTLCLSNGRFAVTSTWQTDDGKSGTGQAFPITADTGTFSFFSANNVEVIVKVLDACSTNAGRWVFAGGLTNVHVVLTVRDTATGSVKTYTNPLDTPFQPIQDTSAFGCN